MANAVAYGFLDLQRIFDQRLSDQSVQTITDAIQASVEVHNREMDALIALFARPTTDHKVRYQQLGAARLQPLDENGRARPILPTGYYDLAFPIRDAGSAWGSTFKARERMTVGDANRMTALMLQADRVWVRDQLLAALFSDTAYTYTDEAYGALTVEVLANGDAVTYMNRNGGAAAVDTHQLGMANAIDDAADDPFPTIHDDLVEHPENDGEVIAFIASGLRASVEALTGFHRVADPNIAQGISSDRLVGSLGVTVPGEVIGYHDAGVWIVDWATLPAKYIVATMTSGEPALAMRQYPEASLQGFIPIDEDRNDHPFYEKQWVRYAGFGAWNRVGAFVVEIEDSSYDPPTGYEAPIW